MTDSSTSQARIHLAGKSMSPALKERLRKLQFQKSSPLSKHQKQEPLQSASHIYSPTKTRKFQNPSKKNLIQSIELPSAKLQVQVTNNHIDTIPITNTVQQIKRIKLDEDIQNPVPALDVQLTSFERKECSLDETKGTKDLCEESLVTCNKIMLQQILKAKKASLAVNQDLLRRLELVKMYRTKNDPKELTTLIEKWREVSQQVLQDLQKKMPDPKPTLGALMHHFNIEPLMLHYSEEYDDFVT